MRKFFLTVGFLTISAVVGAAEHDGKYYRWTDEDGVVHYGDSIPAEYTDLDKQVINEHGVTLAEIEGRKTDEERAAEERAQQMQLQKDMQLRADKALLATYLTVDEIRMHRDRRVELFQAQSRVTELFLSNLESRLQRLERVASRYLPYSTDPDAPQVDPDLVSEINETRSIIQRHQSNLVKFQQEEQTIIARFEGDITRFKSLKGID
ncbi:MAG: DUF4124 domain-containing protein [Woeseiaceae bacterium]